MPCVARAVADGGFYLVLNRGNAPADIFLKAVDVEVFVRVAGEAQAGYPVDPRPVGHSCGIRSRKNEKCHLFISSYDSNADRIARPLNGFTFKSPCRVG